MAIRTLLVIVALCAVPLSAEAAVPGFVTNAVGDASRPKDNKHLDAVRKPAEVLAYSGVKPGDVVAEYLPGGGYFTRLLSDIVGPKGKLYALETTTWGKENVASTQSAVKSLGNVALDLTPLGQFHLPEKADVFWTTDNYHDLHVPKYANVDMAVFNKAVFDSLKPGGS